ncbi:MAG: TrmB family transcriptional regulator [Halobacteriota archaeon]
MTREDEFIHRLAGFGLSEKEAQVYLLLLRYGPKTPSPLAKSLKTYREDVHRTLNSLIEKGMVRPSLHAPTIYAAVDLETALEAVLRKQESELREMEARKRELQELAKQQQFRPSDDAATFKMVKNVKELVAVSITSVTSITNELLYVVPPEMLVIASLFGINAEVKKLIDHGGHARGIADIPYTCVEAAQELLDIGEDLRHYDHYAGVYFGVLDKKLCFHSIRNAASGRIALTERIAVLWADDATYANYLSATFDVLWKQAVPAEERIKELLKEGPPLDTQIYS